LSAALAGGVHGVHGVHGDRPANAELIRIRRPVDRSLREHSDSETVGFIAFPFSNGMSVMWDNG
jgi:hypothetical protein